MKALLVYGSIPTTYWGFQHSIRIIGKPASLPPLGLITLAALLPGDWEVRLVDLNLDDLRDADLLWADAVLVGGMLIQAPSMREVIGRARALGRRVVVGGPAPTTSPELFREAHVIFQGEAEGRIGELLRAVHAQRDSTITLAVRRDRPDLSRSPTPRFDLLEMSRYASMSIQYSRGCPHSCEFCDVIEIFGRVPRVKAPTQVRAELSAIHALGYRGSLFVVDDNFIGNRKAVRRLLPVVQEWQNRHGYPFELYTEASVTLAADAALMGAMVGAGFSSVFVGIETPSREALEAAGKMHNLAVDPHDGIETMTRAGLEVMGGFIVGFDSDGPEIFAQQAALIQSAPMPLAMVGLLGALPGTALWRRLENEGRLRRTPSGDQFERPNFQPVMDEHVLLRGYARLLAEIYSPDAYYRRCAQALRDLGPSHRSRGRFFGDLSALVRAVIHVGVLSPRRRHFWRLLLRALPAGLHAFRRAVVYGVKGEHMIRYTRDEVLPRIERSARAVACEASNTPSALPVRGAA